MVKRVFLLAWLIVLATLLIGTLRDENFWRTPDQRAAAAYGQGEYALAARLFRDPAWKATACYRAGDHACAATYFARGDDALAAYNLGNSQARNGELPVALASFERALRLRPDWRQADDNRALLAQALMPEKKPPRDGRHADADDEAESQRGEDDRGKDGEPGEVSVEKLGPQDADKIWLRTAHSDPAAFLRLRFAAEAGHDAGREAGR